MVFKAEIIRQVKAVDYNTIVQLGKLDVEDEIVNIYDIVGDYDTRDSLYLEDKLIYVYKDGNYFGHMNETSMLVVDENGKLEPVSYEEFKNRYKVIK